MAEIATSNPVAKQIHDLASKHNVRHVAGRWDELASTITRLAGDDVELDETELLLVALGRAGVLSDRETVRMAADYLRHSRP